MTFNRVLLFFIIIFLNSICFAQEFQNKKDFTDKVLDFVILNMDNESIELENLYEKTTEVILDDKLENPLLSEKLKNRGFKEINWGRGNYPPLGAKIFNVSLKKDNCECEVSKIYYYTNFDSTYIIKEKISCKKAD